MAAIRDVVRAVDPEIGFTNSDIRALSLHVGGTMALLMERVDPYIIGLVGRWRRNTMLCYLHKTANIFTESLSA